MSAKQSRSGITFDEVDLSSNFAKVISRISYLKLPYLGLFKQRRVHILNFALISFSIYVKSAVYFFVLQEVRKAYIHDRTNPG